MKNVQTYEKFINEGLFSNYSEAFIKLKKIILDLNPESIITNGKKNVFKFTFIKNPHINNDIDPYGEDNWGNYHQFNIVIEKMKRNVKRNVIFRSDYYYVIFINDVNIKIKNSEAEKLYHLVEKIYKNKEKIKSDSEIKDIIDNL